jgi:hypothetical protein
MHNANWDTTKEDWATTSFLWTSNFIQGGKRVRRGSEDILRDEWGAYEEEFITVFVLVNGKEFSVTKRRKIYINGRKPMEITIRDITQRIIEVMKPNIKVQING